MNKYLRKFILIALIIPSIAFANWQVASSQGGDPFFQTSLGGACSEGKCGQSNKMTPYTQQTAPYGTFPLYAASLKGSLKTNLARLLKRYHWELKWLLPVDYNLSGRLSGDTLEALVEKMVKYFPLRATFYKGNRVVTITARK